MRCDEPPEYCLGDHIARRIEAERSAGGKYRARCPAHDDQEPSLSINVAKGESRRRIVWHCFAGCTDAEVRAAMVRLGVDDECLDTVPEQRTEDELVSSLVAIFETEKPGRRRDLLMAAVILNRGKIPQGPELISLGERAGLSRDQVYRAVNAPEGLAWGQTQLHIPTAAVTQAQNSSANPQVSGPRNAGDEVAKSRLKSRKRDAPFGPSVTPSVTEVAKLQFSVTRCDWVGCQRELPTGRRYRRKVNYCSANCRQRAYQANNPRRDNT